MSCTQARAPLSAARAMAAPDAAEAAAAQSARRGVAVFAVTWLIGRTRRLAALVKPFTLRQIGRRRPMPRQGSQTLSDVRQARLVVACDRCERRGDYSVARLYAQRGDLRLVDLLAELTADCPRRAALDLHQRCNARFVI